MSTTGKSLDEPALKEVLITRILDAPRGLVFKAWTDPKQVARWWGPHEFTNPFVDVDPRPGGAFHVDMQGPDGVVYPNKGVFHEVVAPERLVISTGWVDDDGNSLIEDVATVTFADRDGKTEVTVHAIVVKAVPAAAEALEGMEEGWSQSLERLEELLAKRGSAMEERLSKIIAAPGEREITITRVFDAPRELVFKVVSDPTLVPQWWGPASLTTTVEEMDVRPGGSWRYVQRDPHGNEYIFYGEYREVVPPERIVQTFRLEGIPGESLETLVLEEQDGKTFWRGTSVFESVEARDGMIQSGMEEGLHETYDRLAEVLARSARGQAYAERDAA